MNLRYTLYRRDLLQSVPRHPMLPRCILLALRLILILARHHHTLPPVMLNSCHVRPPLRLLRPACLLLGHRAITAAHYIADYACVRRFVAMFACAYARSGT